MAAPLVFRFIGVVFTAILYGFYCLLFGLYWRIQLKRANRWRCIFFYALIINFLLSTAYFIICIIEVQFKINIAILGQVSLKTPGLWMTIANNTLYTCVDFTSQLVLLYRCWIMWRQPLVMVFPCLLSFAFLGTILTTLGFNIKFVDMDPLPDWYLSSVTAFFALSLTVNALATALIVYKIITVYHTIHEFNISNGKNGHSDLSPIISTLIESGMITFVAQLIQSVMYKTDNDAFPLIAGVVVMLFGISMTAVLVRVAMGISYDHTTIGTVSTLNVGQKTQLSVFASESKFNDSETPEVGKSDSFE